MSNLAQFTIVLLALAAAAGELLVVAGRAQVLVFIYAKKFVI